jgi:hypothetical protein
MKKIVVTVTSNEHVWYPIHFDAEGVRFLVGFALVRLWKSYWLLSEVKYRTIRFSGRRSHRHHNSSTVIGKARFLDDPKLINFF